MIKTDLNDKVNADELINQLICDDVIKCQAARRELVLLGKEVVPSLIKALSSRHHWVRWEAAKALSQIADPASVNTLLKLLEDTEFEMRWIAAEGLIKIGHKALIPILKVLMANPDRTWLQEGVHHIVGDLARGKYRPILKPLVQALESYQPSMEAPLAAKKALDALSSGEP